MVSPQFTRSFDEVNGVALRRPMARLLQQPSISGGTQGLKERCVLNLAEERKMVAEMIQMAAQRKALAIRKDRNAA